MYIHKFIIIFLILIQFKNVDARFISWNNSNLKNKNSYNKSNFFTNEHILSNLNKFKDKYLLNNFIGKTFVDFYYKIQK